ncbi:MAG: hypothetical protein CMH98_06330 [Oceanospirillaceae bacterium]|nr:hypothetical protein [Oceanospirillaceae bacterium]|tara:strand:+ start:44400 stop:46049 length:1650 start_codon:yes stop_codon:yes gene_type:complete
MKIAQSQVQLSGRQQDTLLSAFITGQSARVTAGQSGGDGSGASSAEAGIQLSLSRRIHEQQQISHSSQVTDSDGTVQNYASQFISERLLELTDQTRLSVFAVNPGGNSMGLGVEVEVQSIFKLEESSALNFEALGQVTTEDGRRIDFMMALEFSRNTQVEQTNSFRGELNLIDPLMINLNGGAVELTDQYFSFDLDADGQNDRIAQTAAGSGYLVFDKNGNGEIDDGSEMFGPQSGYGFDELAQYDDDGNGWIDENDAIFSQLGLMQFNEDGSYVQSATEAGLGALYLGSVASDYEVLNDDGDVQGVIKGSGVALSESGNTLLLQEVHLRKAPQLSDPFYDNGRDFPATDFTAGIPSENNDGAEGIRIESALSFFQFDNTLLNSRNAETHVSMRREDDPTSGAAIMRATEEETTEVLARLRAQQKLPADSAEQALWNQESGHSQSPSTSSQPDKSQRMNMRDWVSNVMQNAAPLQQRDNKPEFVMREMPAEVKSRSFNLSDEIGGQNKTEENKLSDLRAAIEELKQMRQQQQQGEKHLGLYRAIGRMNW